jgi:hypothetical protein
VVWGAALGGVLLAVAAALGLARRPDTPRNDDPTRAAADPTTREKPTTPARPALGSVRPYLTDDAGVVAVVHVGPVVHDPVIARHLAPVREALRRQFGPLGFDPAEALERVTLVIQRDDPRRLVLVADHAPLPNTFYPQIERDHPVRKKLTLPAFGKTETAYQVSLENPPRSAWLAVLGPRALALATDDRDLKEVLAKSAGRVTKLHDADLDRLFTGRDKGATFWLGVSGRQAWEERKPTLSDAAGVSAWRVQARLGDGLEADFEATTDRPEPAKQFLGFLMLSAGQQPGLGRLLAKAQKSEAREGQLTHLRLTSRLTREEFDAAVRRVLEAAGQPPG